MGNNDDEKGGNAKVKKEKDYALKKEGGGGDGWHGWVAGEHEIAPRGCLAGRKRAPR